jgi:hypothetical protein
MSISSFLTRSSIAAVAVTFGGCGVSDVQDPATRSTLAAGVASYAAQPSRDKVDICHWASDENAFILISVASPAVDAHVAHGDGLPGAAFPGQPGMRFGPNCRPEIIPFNLTFSAAAQGVVRDANHDGVGDAILPSSPLQSINGFAVETRAVLEFGIGQFSQPVGHAELNLVLDNAGPVPLNVGAYSYAGDGAVTVSDFAAGSLAAAFTCVNPGSGQADLVTSFECLLGRQITVDVTAALNSLIASHAAYAGFNFRAPLPNIASGPYSFVINAVNLHVRSP